MTPWTKLSVEERLTILTNIADEKGIVENAVEKDYPSIKWKQLNLEKLAKHNPQKLEEEVKKLVAIFCL